MPPPIVPGIAHANSKPPSPASRARWRQTAFAAPAPARMTSPSTSTRASSPPSLRTSASTPASAARRFEPRPTTATAMPRSAAHCRSSATSSGVSGRAKRARRPAGPERRVAGELDSLLDLHASRSSTIAAARSTSPAPSVRTVSPGRAQLATSSAAVLERRRPADPHSRPRDRELVDDQPPAHARHRSLARGIDLGHARGVRAGERLREAVRQVTRSRVEMRLEERDDAPAVSHGGDVGRELGGMVRVAVEDAHAARLAPRLEAPPGAGELDDHALGVGPRDTCELERCERRGCVPAVVLARHREVERHGLELLGAHDVRHVREPLLEERLDLCARGELGVVVEVDVEEDGDLRLQRADRAVGLVALHDEPSLPRARVPVELRDLAADEERRIEAEPVEAEGDHRARRRLAVRPGDDDRAAKGDELGEELGPRPPVDLAGEGGRDVDLPAVGRLRRLGRDLDRDAFEMPEVRRLDAIPAGDLGAPRAREERVAAHAGAADAGDPDAPTGERGRRAHRRSPLLHPAWRRRASPRPSPRAGTGRRAAPRRRAAPCPLPPPARRPRRRRRRTSARSSPGARRSRTRPGTRTAGSPAAASSQTEPPARASTMSAAPYARPISSMNGRRT